ncbi:MAG: type II secretion system protein [bacterium]|nr:type II secretion system protein [bacterium]
MIFRYFDISIFKYATVLRRGFTMIEVVVMLGIVTAISSVVLFSFTGLNENGALNRSVRELALNIRKAQNASLAVTEQMVGSPAVATLPPAVGLELTINDSSYRIFADLDSPTPRDFKYSGLSEKIGEDEVFLKNIRVLELNTPSGNQSKINIIFTAPEASIVITQADGVVVGNKVDIKIEAPTTRQTKTVTVRTSGQITVK